VTAITRRGLFGLLACALVPGQAQALLTHDTQVRHRLVILEEEVVYSPHEFGGFDSMMYRVLADMDGRRAYGVAHITQGVWENLETRALVRREVRNMLEGNYLRVWRADTVVMS
jgi:predicted DCC family thiol-disulfide oxidoreductase YuxK